jgi:hypothetical protein
MTAPGYDILFPPVSSPRPHPVGRRGRPRTLLAIVGFYGKDCHGEETDA